MAINTPITSTGDFFGIRSRSAWREEASQLRQELLMLKYRLDKIERSVQEQRHLARMHTNQHTQYFHVVSAQPGEAPTPTEQVTPGDISHVPTQDLPPLSAEESAGEDEDVTYVHRAISKGAHVTEHHLSKDSPVGDLHAALTEHLRTCGMPTSVIISNGFVGCTLLKPLANFPHIRLRYNGHLHDNVFLCASYEDGGSYGTVSSASPQLG